MLLPDCCSRLCGGENFTFKKAGEALAEAEGLIWLKLALLLVRCLHGVHLIQARSLEHTHAASDSRENRDVCLCAASYYAEAAVCRPNLCAAWEHIRRPAR